MVGVFDSVRPDAFEILRIGSREHAEFVRGTFETYGRLFADWDDAYSELDLSVLGKFILEQDWSASLCRAFGEDQDVCEALVWFTHPRNLGLFKEVLRINFRYGGDGKKGVTNAESLSVAVRLFASLAMIAEFLGLPLGFVILYSSCIGTDAHVHDEAKLWFKVLERKVKNADKALDTFLKASICEELPGFVRLLVRRVVRMFGGEGLAGEAGVGVLRLGLAVLRANAGLWKVVEHSGYVAALEFQSVADRDSFIKKFGGFGVKSLGGNRVSLGYLPAREDVVSWLLDRYGFRAKLVFGSRRFVRNPTGAFPPELVDELRGSHGLPENYGGILAWDWVHAGLPAVLIEWKHLGWLSRGTFGEYLRLFPEEIRLQALALTLLETR